MSTPRDVGRSIGKAMGGAAKGIQVGRRKAMLDAAAIARRELGETAPLVPGPDRRFSRFRRAGRLAVRTRLARDHSSVYVGPLGPWGIAEEGAKPHAIKVYGRGTGRHPGTRSKQGRRAWTRGKEATLRIVTGEAPQTIADEVTKGFDNG